MAGQRRIEEVPDASLPLRPARSTVSGTQKHSIRYARPVESSSSLSGSSARYSFASDSHCSLVVVFGWACHNGASLTSGLSVGRKYRHSTHALWAWAIAPRGEQGEGRGAARRHVRVVSSLALLGSCSFHADPLVGAPRP